jgi:hypothetical protein
VLWRHRSAFAGLVPWLGLSLVAICTAAATATARLAYGLEQAYSSRYTTISLLLIMSTLVVMVRALQLAWATDSGRGVVTRIAQALPAIGILWAVLAFADSHNAVMREMDNFSGRLHAAQDCVKSASSVEDDCLLVVYPDKQAAWERLEYMRGIGWVVPENH